jgi:uncharacterized membrane protein
MKTQYRIPLAVLVPLFVVVILAVFGVTFSFWVYLILSVSCLLAAGITWFLYKDMEKKVDATKKKEKMTPDNDDFR